MYLEKLHDSRFRFKMIEANHFNLYTFTSKSTPKYFGLCMQ